MNDFVNIQSQIKRPISSSITDFESTMSETSNHQAFLLNDALQFVKLGGQAIVQDEFSKCFQQKPRRSFLSLVWKLCNKPVKFIKFLIRYFIKFPYRVLLLISCSVAFWTALPIVSLLGDPQWKRLLMKYYCKAFLASWGMKLRIHGEKPPCSDQKSVFVSNHTSIIDYIVLSSHQYPHSTVSQTHNGVLGFLQRTLAQTNGTLLFDRNKKQDRADVFKKISRHVQDTTKSPLLIFPEGTCVNNEYTVLFHKGAFELDAQVVPVAIKYDKSKADAYWHSKKQSFVGHLLYLMTRWSLEADVWYLKPRRIGQGQSSTQFAEQVKAEISEVAGLKNLHWDGYWKNFNPSFEKQEQLKEDPRNRYGKLILQRSSSKSGLSVMRKRRCSLDNYGPVSNDIPQNKSFSGIENISLRNQVLVSLQEQERKGLGLGNKIDIIETWKMASKKNQKWSNNLDLDSIRMENMSWRLWFKKWVPPRNRLRIETYFDTVSVFEMISDAILLPSPFIGDLFGLDGQNTNFGIDSSSHFHHY